jgi:hypothetical protein
MLTAEAVAKTLRRCLESGRCVEIDGLGTFRPCDGGGYEFEPESRPSVFIAYVMENAAFADRLYDRLAAEGFNPWMDRRKLMPGQNWPRAVERAIAIADFFVPCFSHRSVVKRSPFQRELRYAIDGASRLPLDQVFIIPVRITACAVPQVISSQLQYVDFFPDWEAGFRRVSAAITEEMRRRKEIST